jgi:hypothetical protein
MFLGEQPEDFLTNLRLSQLRLILLITVRNVGYKNNFLNIVFVFGTNIW